MAIKLHVSGSCPYHLNPPKYQIAQIYVRTTCVIIYTTSHMHEQERGVACMKCGEIGKETNRACEYEWAC